MSDLISREALIAEINRIGGHWLSGWDTAGVLSLASRIPAVDAIPVVRCKDCGHHEKCHIESLFEDWGIENPYCCIGELEGRKCG